MISHYLNKIYNEMLMTESSITDDVKQAMVSQLEGVNEIFYKYNFSDFAKIYHGDLDDASIAFLSLSTIEYACRGATKWYDNISKAVAFMYKRVLKGGAPGVSVSWWGIASLTKEYIKYCERFNKSIKIVDDFIASLLQRKDDVDVFDGAIHIIDAYIHTSNVFNHEFDVLLKSVVVDYIKNNGKTNYIVRCIMSDYYKYYARTMKKPCAWIDELICNMNDELEATSMLNSMYMTRFGVAPQHEKNIFTRQSFVSKICNKQA